MTLTDAASVLSAGGTVGAFGVALYLLSVQIRDRRAEARDRRAAQARLVSAWFDDVSPVNDIDGTRKRIELSPLLGSTQYSQYADLLLKHLPEEPARPSKVALAWRMEAVFRSKQ